MKIEEIKVSVSCPARNFVTVKITTEDGTVGWGDATLNGRDMALWDIKGKVADLPVYQLLGGQSRNKIKVYGHANGETIDETLDHLGKLIEQGFKAVRLQCALPNSKDSYGTLGDKKDYYELQSNSPLPPEQEWNTTKYLNFIPHIFQLVD